MNFLNANNQQIKSIIESDGECPPHLLQQAIDEAIRRDLYNNYIVRLLNKRFKAIKYAEHKLKMSFEEIKYFCYERSMDAIKHFKPGKRGFLSFWALFMHTAINTEARKYVMQMRTAEITYLDDDENLIQLVDDKNTERKAVNRVFLESLLSRLSPKDREILLMYNNNYTFKEIGERYGVTRQYIIKRYYNTIDRLKRLGA